MAELTLGERFCRRLIDSMPNPQARTIIVMELAKWAGKTLYLPAAKRGDRRKSIAANMLIEGMSDAEAAIAIHERFGVGLRTAQRDVKTARQMSRLSVVPTT